MRLSLYLQNFLQHCLGLKNFKRRQPYYIHSYLKYTSTLLRSHDKKTAMSLAVGGEFEAIGQLEYYLLLELGLKKHHTVIDVGCGSGRLAVQLVPFLEGRYIGIDVVPELLKHAKDICQRPDWSFSIGQGLTIPEDDESADIICFFSVFTHLLHEESFLYLQDAKRVLKPSGRIVFSFLEFANPDHWTIFEHSLKDQNPDKILNQFISREAIEVWVRHLNVTIESFYDGGKPHIPLPDVIKFSNGQEIREKGGFWQSVCVLTK